MEKKRYSIFILIGVLALIYIFAPTPLLLHPPFFLDDFVSQVFYVLNKKISPARALVLVSVDDNSFNQINQGWPLRRSLYAQALNRLNQEGARVIGFDFIFKGEGQLNDDDEFIAALKNAQGKVILGYFLNKDGDPEYPQSTFRANTPVGFINAFADRDGVIRRIRGYFSKNDFSDFSFAVKLAALYKGVSPEHANGFIVLGRDKVPLKQNSIILLNYLLMPSDVTTVSMVDLLNGKYIPGLFKDKLVLVGPTLEMAHDNHRTPLTNMPGVFIHINSIFNILEGQTLTPFPFTFFVSLCALFLVGCIVSSFSFIRGLFLSLGVVLMLLWLDIILRPFGFMLPFGSIAIALFGFLIAANFYNYAFYIILLLRIKHKMVLDPFTSLYYPRYFYERLNVESKNIPRRYRHLVLIVLDGFAVFSKGNDFHGLKELWQMLSRYLFSCSPLWAVYNEEAIIGCVAKHNDARKIKNVLERIFSLKAITLKIKVGVVLVKPNKDIREMIPHCLDYLKNNAQDIVFFTPEMFQGLADIKHPVTDVLYSLSVDADDKNIELLKLVGELKQAQGKIKEAYFQLVSSLVAALESKDSYTKGHSQRVCNYAFMLANKLGLSHDEKEKIREAALLHDLGKIGISDSILHKHGQLSEEEFRVIKEHEIISAKILEPISDFKDIIPYVLYHHESYDGSGYPHGLAADFIPLGARILAVADVFDALTTGRDYKTALTTADAVSELERMKGKKLDPVLVDNFVQALIEFHLLPAS